MIPILYEDGDILVVDKPSGMIVHPAPGHGDGAMTDELLRTRPAMRTVGSPDRPGVVHRLDLETSGVMVFAKTQDAYLSLRRAFESHRNVGKTYLAVVHGRPPEREGTIDEPVGRDRRNAISHWNVLGSRHGVSLVEFRIETGRMHQIRLHAKALGCPVVGDSRYGDGVRDRHLRHRPRRLLLHAVELSFPHPADGRPMSFSAPPPSDLVYAV